MARTLSKRNGEIDFWKFVASIYVVLFHSRAFYNPDLFRGSMALAVEFFFVVSGYFYASSVYRDKREFNSRTIGSESVRFIWHKVNGFLYYFLFGFLLSFFAGLYMNGFSKMVSLERIKNYLFEFFLLTHLTSTPSSVIPADWYLSAMLVAMFFLYPFFRYKKDVFSAYIAPLIGFGGLGYLMNKYGILTSGVDGEFPSKGLIRAIVSICLGIVAYRISEHLKVIEFGKSGIVILSTISAVSVLATFILLIRMPKEVQPLAVVLSMVFVAISTSGKSVFSKLFPAKICQKLGEFSLSIYLVHPAVRTFLRAFTQHHTVFKQYFQNGDGQWIGVLIYLGCSVLLALIVMVAVHQIKAIIATKKRKKEQQSVVI